MSENMNAGEPSAATELVSARWRTTERRMYPEVAAYLSSFREVQRNYDRAINESHFARQSAEREATYAAEDEGRYFDRYDNATDRATHRAYIDAQTAANNAASTAKTAALAALKAGLVNSEHKEVAWIAENCLFNNQGDEVEGYARDILAILPATTEQIWEEAKDNRGMCDVFDRFYDQADSAGIFTSGNPLAGAREMAALRSYVRRTWGQGYTRNLQPQIDRIVKAVREDGEKRLEAARAEWQRLDEARAENTAHNRSEGARRAAETRRRNAAALADGEEAQAEITREVLRGRINSLGRQVSGMTAPAMGEDKAEQFESVDAF